MFHSHKINYILLFLISLAFGWQLLRPGFFTTQDDLQTMRLYEMNTCFQNGQIPCRWSPDMGSGYGQPTFNYYSVFPYSLGEIFHTSGFGYVDTVKILFLLCLVLSAVFSYAFLSEILSAPAALIGSAAYLITPFRALDIFVRGALAEAMALSLIPLVLLFIIKTLKKTSASNIAGLSISLGLFLITHNITTLLSIPFIFLFTVCAIIIYRSSIKTIPFLIAGVLLGAGLSAFFTLPVALERGLIQSSNLTQGYFDFRAHFVTLKQLFLSNNWGYGPSIPGPNDDLSFSVGIFQTIILLISPVFFFLKKNKSRNLFIIGIFSWLITLFYIFLTHNRSTFIWEHFSFLSFVQFPWRSLGMVAVGTSLLTAVSLDLLPSKNHHFIVIPSLLILIALNFNFYRFDHYLPNYTDQTALTGSEFVRQQRSTLTDYLPVSSKSIPETLAPSWPQTTSTQVNINYFDKRSNYFASEFDIYEDSATITFPIVYFPGWEIHHNRSGDLYPISYNNDLGLITVKLDKGHQVIQGFFENTPPRMVGNLITFLSACGLLLWCVLDKHET